VSVQTRVEGMRLNAVQEAFFVWALSFAAIVVTFIFLRGYAKLVATASFLYLPVLFMRKRDEDHATYGATLKNWKSDVKLFVQLSAVMVPAFFVLFAVYAEALPHLPEAWARLLSPYVSRPDFHFRLPARLPERIIDELFVVALPEEFFYRGFIQTRLRDAWPQGRRFLGGRLGKAFWVTAILFALGHLAIFQFWRLSVFFPALVFGWMRERTGTVAGATLFHAFSNLYMHTLEASFFGLR